MEAVRAEIELQVGRWVRVWSRHSEPRLMTRVSSLERDLGFGVRGAREVMKKAEKRFRRIAMDPEP
eukprot:735899-Amorphochlora_amoeboformis.AAC.1